jgi:hypothetical protein
MSRFQISELDPRLLNPDVWPAVAEDAIKDPIELDRYQRRRNAIRLLVSGASRREIAEKMNIDKKSVIRFFNRCLLVHQTAGYTDFVLSFRLLGLRHTVDLPLCR